MNIVFLVFSYSSYFRCGWQEHVYKNNRPKEIQCQKNAVFQPTRIVRKQECVHCDKGNLLKGFDKKNVKKRTYSSSKSFYRSHIGRYACIPSRARLNGFMSKFLEKIFKI